jgi:hypothetical protein
MATWTHYDYDNAYTQADGTKIFLGVKEWAELTLTGSDLAEWEADFATIQAHETPLQAAGTMVIQDMVATVTIGDRSYNTCQGRLFTLESDTDSEPLWHPLWDKWATDDARSMAKDPNITMIWGEWKLGNFLS